MTYLLKNDEGQYLSDIDSAESKVTFTTVQKDAKQYGGGEWFADTELEYVKFHFKDRPEVATLHVVREMVSE